MVCPVTHSGLPHHTPRPSQPAPSLTAVACVAPTLPPARTETCPAFPTTTLLDRHFLLSHPSTAPPLVLSPIPAVSLSPPPWCRPGGYLAALDAAGGGRYGGPSKKREQGQKGDKRVGECRSREESVHVSLSSVVQPFISRHRPSSLSPPPPPATPACWSDVPTDIITLVLACLPPHDIQATLLVCAAWSTGFSHGLVSLRPRFLAVPRLAARFPALARLDLAACRRVTDGDVIALAASLPKLSALSLSGAEGVTDGGVAALHGLTGLASLSVYNCCRVRKPHSEESGAVGRRSPRSACVAAPPLLPPPPERSIPSSPFSLHPSPHPLRSPTRVPPPSPCAPPCATWTPRVRSPSAPTASGPWRPAWPPSPRSAQAGARASPPLGTRGPLRWRPWARACWTLT